MRYKSNALLKFKEIFHGLHVRYLYCEHIGFFPLCDREEHGLLFVPVYKVRVRKICGCSKNRQFLAEIGSSIKSLLVVL